LEAFERVEVHRLHHEGEMVEIFGPTLTEQQRQQLHLVGVPEEVYAS
jgi:hypothetical protein